MKLPTIPRILKLSFSLLLLVQIQGAMAHNIHTIHRLHRLAGVLLLIQAQGTVAQNTLNLFCLSIYPESNSVGLPLNSDHEMELFDPEDVLDHMTVGTTGPISMQGLFWLKDIPTDNSLPEIVSFAYTNEGGGLGLGLESSTTNPPSRRIRLMSQGNWAVPIDSAEDSIQELTYQSDTTLVFVLEAGTVAEPTSFVINTDVAIGGTCMRVSFNDCLWPLPEGAMVLQNAPGGAGGFPEHEDYKESYVWRREGQVDASGSSRGDWNYPVVQVVNGQGEKIEPAFSEWLAEAQDEGEYVTRVLKENPGPQRCTSAPFWCFWCS